MRSGSGHVTTRTNTPPRSSCRKGEEDRGVPEEKLCTKMLKALLKT